MEFHIHNQSLSLSYRWQNVEVPTHKSGTPSIYVCSKYQGVSIKLPFIIPPEETISLSSHLKVPSLCYGISNGSHGEEMKCSHE